MLLNLIRNPYSKLTLMLLLSCLTYTASAQKAQPLFACGISGPTSVTYGSEATFTLTGGCTVTGWNTTCGVISSQTSTSCMIFFNTPNCSSATITVTGNTAAAHTVSISGSTSTPLSGGSISNTSQTINYNTTPSQISASAASGGTCSGAYTYQWYSSPDGSSYNPISGATSQNYQPGSLTATTYYKRLATCSGSTTYTSNVATVTVYGQLVGGSISPSSQSINNGASPSTLTLSGVSGGNGSYTYQWQSSPDNSTWTAVSGQTGTSYSPGSLTAAAYYRVVVTSNGVSVNSASATVTVYPTLNAGSINPGFQEIISNTVPASMSVSGTSGGNGAYSYQWQWSTDLDTWMDLTGATSATYTPPALTDLTFFQVIVTSNGATATTSFAVIEVLPPLQGGSVSPATQTINYNTVPAPIVIDDDASGGDGAYTYQWQSSPDNSTWTNISGQTGKSYFPPALTATTYYRVEILDAGTNAFSSSALVTVYPPLQPGSLTPASQTITSGTPATISLSGTTGGSGTYTYQWQSSFDNNSWTNVNGQTTTSYTPPPVSPGINYRVAVTSNGVTAYTTSVNILVNEPLTGGTITGPSGAIGYNTSPGTLNSTQDAFGGSCFPGDYRYQWQYSTDGVNFYNLAGATGDSYTPATPMTLSLYFRRQVSCSANTTNSNTIYVQVTPQAQQNCSAPQH